MQPEVTADADLDWPVLIDRARGGDDVSLAEIVKQTRSYLIAVAESHVGPAVQSKFGASDVVQQSLLEASQQIEAFRGQTEGELRSWVKRIVLHNLTDAARQFTDTQSRDSSRESSVNSDDKSLGIACSNSKTASWLLSRRELDDQLMDAVSKLPNRQRIVVEGRHRDGLSYEEIAQQLCITANAARNLWTRAMHNLRDILKTNDDGQPRERERTEYPR